MTKNYSSQKEIEDRDDADVTDQTTIDRDDSDLSDKQVNNFPFSEWRKK